VIYLPAKSVLPNPVPHVAASGALVLDVTSLTEDEVLAQVEESARRKPDL